MINRQRSDLKHHIRDEGHSSPSTLVQLRYLLTAALAARPAVIAPVVTRPAETVLDRAALGLAPAEASRHGVYCLREAASGTADGTIVLQGSELSYAFLGEALPRLLADGLDLEVFAISSAELFDRKDEQERDAIFSPAQAARAMGITGFTLPTLYRWVSSAAGRRASLHPFQKGRFLGSGSGSRVLEQAGLDGASQDRAIRAYLGR